MLTHYPTAPRERESATETNSTWVDLLNPTDEEIASVQARFGLKLPSREELSEIETSSRISEKNGFLILSMPVVANAHDLEEDPSPLGFVLAEEFLVTIRYTRLRSFETVGSKFSGANPRSSIDTFSTLVEEM